MGAASDILKQYNLFVDGVGFAGQTQELQLPNLTIIEEDFRAGGMDAPVGIDLGMEKLEMSFTLPGSSTHVLSRFGLASGSQTKLTARGSLESFSGGITPVVAAMAGRIKSVEPAAWQGGQISAWAYTVSLVYYRYEQAGQVIHEIDVLNMKRIINGVDQLAQHRANIGL